MSILLVGLETCVYLYMILRGLETLSLVLDKGLTLDMDSCPDYWPCILEKKKKQFRQFLMPVVPWWSYPSLAGRDIKPLGGGGG